MRQGPSSYSASVQPQSGGPFIFREEFNATGRSYNAAPGVPALGASLLDERWRQWQPYGVTAVPPFVVDA